MSEPTPIIDEMRLMLAMARQDFRERAAPLIDDDETRAMVDSLATAVGEVSADDAFEALQRWKAERRR